MGGEAISLLELEVGTEPPLSPVPARKYSSRQSWMAKIFRIGFLLLPSFIQPLLDDSATKKKKLHVTSWLDGLRGVASLIVFIGHYVGSYHQGIWYGYGYKNNLYLVQLPIIRLLYTGHAMVILFFVISGYTLSYKPLKLLRNQQWDQLLQTMSSSTFRRAARLFLPTTISTFIIMLIIQLGLYEYPRQFAFDTDALPGVMHELHPVRYPTFTEQLFDWMKVVLETSNPFRWEDPTNFYDVHLWSIPCEFRGSLVLAITILGLARAQVLVRFLLTMVIIIYSLWVGRREITMFLCGLFLAEIHMIQAHSSTSSVNNFDPQQPERTWRSQLPWVAAFILGLFLFSQPEAGSEETPGYIFLAWLIPAEFFWECLGAVVIVWAISNSEILQGIFTTKVTQYLGDISFAIYLVHGSVLHTVGYSVIPNIMKLVGKDSMVMFEAGFFLSSFIVIPVTIWLADLFWRFVDVPVLGLIKQVEAKCCVRPTI